MDLYGFLCSTDSGDNTFEPNQLMSIESRIMQEDWIAAQGSPRHLVRTKPKQGLPQNAIKCGRNSARTKENRKLALQSGTSREKRKKGDNSAVPRAPARKSKPPGMADSSAAFGNITSNDTLRKVLDLDKFIVEGHSIMGAVVLQYARKYPEPVSQVVMIGTPRTYGTEGYKQAMDDYWEVAFPPLQYDLIDEICTLPNPIFKNG